MKKNKTVAYMLAATLLVGGTFLGTKALFTDKLEAGGELSISTGDIDIDLLKDSGWNIDRNGEEDNIGTKDDGKEIDFDNLKPGDVLTKEIQIKNDGTLKANVNLVQNDTLEKSLGNLYNTFITVSETFTTKDGDNLLEPGEEATIKLQLSVNDPGLTGQHNKNGSYNKDDMEKQRIELNNAWTLNATQQDETIK